VAVEVPHPSSASESTGPTVGLRQLNDGDGSTEIIYS